MLKKVGIFMGALLLIQSMAFAAETNSSSVSGPGGLQMGFGVSSVVMDGATWTRVNLLPTIPVWKFKFAFDVEVFIDDKGNFSQKSWDFSTFDAGFDTVQRKIYYISFSDKNEVVLGQDVFYARIGALDNITLGQGMLVNNYANTLTYPMDKKLGLDFALGNLFPIKLGVEGVFGNLADLAKGGGWFGVRAFASPFAPLNIPVVSAIQFGVSFAGDINQYSGLKDSDGDSYPDEVDKFPYDKAKYADSDGDGIADNDAKEIDLDGDGLVDYTNLTVTQKQNLTNTLAGYGIVNNTIDFDVQRTSVFTLAGKTDFYGIFGADMIVPIVNNASISANFYVQFGMSVDPVQTADSNTAAGWGISGPGVVLKIPSIVDFRVEYRQQSGKFQTEYFGYDYDQKRAMLLNNGAYVTRDNLLSNNNVLGVFGSLKLNLWLIYAYASFEYLAPAMTGTDKDIFSFVAKATLNKDVLSKIEVIKPYLGDIEAYYEARNVNKIDLLWKDNPAIRMGVKASIRLGGSTSVEYKIERSFDLNSKAVDFMGISTGFAF